MAEDGQRLAGTDPEDDGTGRDDTVAIGVDDGEFARSKDEIDDLGGVGGEVDALETGEGADGCAFDVGMGDVELADVVASDGADVGDARGDEDRRIAGEGGFGVLRGGKGASRLRR